jgi:hypothetical protein
MRQCDTPAFQMFRAAMNLGLFRLEFPICSGIDESDLLGFLSTARAECLLTFLTPVIISDDFLVWCLTSRNDDSPSLPVHFNQDRFLAATIPRPISLKSSLSFRRAALATRHWRDPLVKMGCARNIDF